MTFLGGIFASGAAGSNQAERAESAQTRKRAADKAREKETDPTRDNQGQDEVVVRVEAAEAIRNLKANDQEEAHEDRVAHAHYDRRGAASQDDQPKLDIEG
jgi:hypothetical protein